MSWEKPVSGELRCEHCLAVFEATEVTAYHADGCPECGTPWGGSSLSMYGGDPVVGDGAAEADAGMGEAGETVLCPSCGRRTPMYEAQAFERCLGCGHAFSSGEMGKEPGTPGRDIDGRLIVLDLPVGNAVDRMYEGGRGEVRRIACQACGRWVSLAAVLETGECPTQGCGRVFSSEDLTDGLVSGGYAWGEGLDSPSDFVSKSEVGEVERLYVDAQHSGGGHPYAQSATGVNWTGEEMDPWLLIVDSAFFKETDFGIVVFRRRG